MHPVVPLGDSVAGGDDAELDGGAPRLEDPLLDIIGNQPQVVMAGHDPVPGIGHPDQGPRKIIIAVPHRLIEPPHLRTTPAAAKYPCFAKPYSLLLWKKFFSTRPCQNIFSNLTQRGKAATKKMPKMA